MARKDVRKESSDANEDAMIARLLEGFDGDTGDPEGEDFGSLLRKLRPDRGESQEAEMRQLLEGLPGEESAEPISPIEGVRKLLGGRAERLRGSPPPWTPPTAPTPPPPPQAAVRPESTTTELSTPITLHDLFGPDDDSHGVPSAFALGSPGILAGMGGMSALQDYSGPMSGGLSSLPAVLAGPPDEGEGPDVAALDMLGPRRVMARKRIHRFFVESVGTRLNLRILRLFVLSGLEKVSATELEEELIERAEVLTPALGRLVETGLLLLEGERYSLNPRARGASVLGSLISRWIQPATRAEVWEWIRDAEAGG